MGCGEVPKLTSQHSGPQSNPLPWEGTPCPFSWGTTFDWGSRASGSAHPFPVVALQKARVLLDSLAGVGGAIVESKDALSPPNR